MSLNKQCSTCNSSSKLSYTLSYRLLTTHHYIITTQQWDPGLAEAFTVRGSLGATRWKVPLGSSRDRSVLIAMMNSSGIGFGCSYQPTSLPTNLARKYGRYVPVYFARKPTLILTDLEVAKEICQVSLHHPPIISHLIISITSMTSSLVYLQWTSSRN